MRRRRTSGTVPSTDPKTRRRILDEGGGSAFLSALDTSKNPKFVFAATVLLLVASALAARWSLLTSTPRVVSTAVSLHQFDVAEATLKRMQRWGINDPQWLVLRARIERLRGDTDGAQELLEHAEGQAVPQGLVQRERLLLDTQKQVERVSLDEIEDALNDDPSDANAVYEAVVIGLGAAGDFPAVFTVLERWDSFAPNSPLPHYYRGKIQLVLEQFELAEKSFLTALELNTEFVPARLDLVRCLNAQSKKRAAIQVADRLISEVPELVEARRIRAELLRDEPQQDQRLTDLRMIIERYPGDYGARLDLAQMYLRSGEADRAIETLIPIAIEHKNDVSMNYVLAESYHQIGNRALADTYLNRYLHGRQKLDELLKLEQRHEEFQGVDTSIAKRLATGFLKYRWRKAEVWAAEAYLRDPEDPEILRAVGEVARLRQDRTRSKRFLAAASSLETDRSRQGT